MQAAENRSRLDASYRLNGTLDRCVLVQGQMRASRIVVIDIARQHMTQVPLPEYDHMVKALPADRADQTLRIAVLPG